MSVQIPPTIVSQSVRPDEVFPSFVTRALIPSHPNGYDFEVFRVDQGTVGFIGLVV
jgi:hypothetical protein